MKHKTWFRLMLKLLGVWFLCMGITSAFDYAGSWMSTWLFDPRGTRVVAFYDLSTMQSHFGIGLSLFFGGKWIVNKAIPSNRPYCHECGYDLTGATTDVCNECGTPFRPVEAAKIHHE